MALLLGQPMSNGPGAAKNAFALRWFVLGERIKFVMNLLPRPFLIITIKKLFLRCFVSFPFTALLPLSSFLRQSSHADFGNFL